MRIPDHLPESVNRPGWTQDNLRAFEDLHQYRNGRYEVRCGHFVDTQGFATMSDLRFLEGGGYENGH